MSTNLEAALSAADAGCFVFPCHKVNKRPLVRWKQVATACKSTIESLWERHPKAMPGLVTGPASGYSVIDLDIKNGKDGLAEFCRLGWSNGHCVSMRIVFLWLHATSFDRVQSHLQHTICQCSRSFSFLVVFYLRESMDQKQRKPRRVHYAAGKILFHQPSLSFYSITKNVNMLEQQSRSCIHWQYESWMKVKV